MKMIGAVLAGLVLLVVLATGLMFVSYSNQEVRLRQQVEAKMEANEAVFDKTWKVVAQQAQVTDQYKDAFKDIYVGIMEARYESGGALMKWVQESNPNFDSALYSRLQTSIESNRSEFTTNQVALIDLGREHNVLLKTIPSSFFVGGRPAIELRIVTSAKTDAAFSSGKEDDINVFPTTESK